MGTPENNTEKRQPKLDTYRQAPSMPLIAEMNYPPHLAEVIKATEAAYDDWAEADTAYAEALDNLEQAEITFAAEIKKAAAKGDPLPAPLDLAPLQNAITYADEVLRLKRQETNKRIGALREAFRTHRLEIAALAVAKAEAGADTYKTRMSEIAQSLDEIERDRRAAYDGLKMFADYSGPEMLYSPQFETSNAPILPNAAERHPRSIIRNLKHVFFSEAEQVESPEQSELEASEPETAEEIETPRPAAKRAKTL